MLRKIGLIVTVSFLAYAGLFLVKSPAQASSRISNVTVTGTSPELGGMNEITVSFTASPAIPAHTRIIINPWISGTQCTTGEVCVFDFASATAEGIDADLWQNPEIYPHPAFFSVTTRDAELSGTISFTIKQAVNPTKTGRYAITVNLQLPPNDALESGASSNQINVGDVSSIPATDTSVPTTPIPTGTNNELPFLPTSSFIAASPIAKTGPQVTIWDGAGNRKLSFFAYSSKQRFSTQIAMADVDSDGSNEIIVAPGAGSAPVVKVFNLLGVLEKQFNAYSASMKSGIRLAVADVNSDLVPEIITVPMAGAAPRVRIFNSAGKIKNQFYAYSTTFTGGTNLAVGDVNADGKNEIITVPASGTSTAKVRIFRNTGSIVKQFTAYGGSVKGGFHVVAGDVNTDGTVDVIISPGPGNAPQIAMFKGNGSLIGRVNAYSSSFRGGVLVSVGDVNANLINELVVTPESQAAARVRVLTYKGVQISQFYAYANTSRGSFSTFVADVDMDGFREIVIAPVAGLGPQIKVFNYLGTAEKAFNIYATSFRGGLNIYPVAAF